MHIQRRRQLQSIQRAEPEDVAVLLEESLGFRVVRIGYRNHRQHAFWSAINSSAHGYAL
jgi:hypothetical protein